VTVELTIERWGGIGSLIFSVPHTDIKILAIVDESGMRGAIYNPCKLSEPVPWLDRCPHCRKGEQEHVPLKIRKLVQALCTNKPDGPDGYRFTLPNRYRLGARLTPQGWGIRIRKPENGATLHVVKMKGKEPMELQESARDFRSPILLRMLRMLFSAREANETEMQAILLPLRRQDLTSLSPSRRTPCWTSLNRTPQPPNP
jgi:hypothetical protein